MRQRVELVRLKFLQGLPLRVLRDLERLRERRRLRLCWKRPTVWVDCGVGMSCEGLRRRRVSERAWSTARGTELVGLSGQSRVWAEELRRELSGFDDVVQFFVREPLGCYLGVSERLVLCFPGSRTGWKAALKICCCEPPQAPYPSREPSAPLTAADF